MPQGWSPVFSWIFSWGVMWVPIYGLYFGHQLLVEIIWTVFLEKLLFKQQRFFGLLLKIKEWLEGFFTLDSSRTILLLLWPQVTEPGRVDIWDVPGCLCVGEGVRPCPGEAVNCPTPLTLRASISAWQSCQPWHTRDRAPIYLKPTPEWPDEQPNDPPGEPMKAKGYLRPSRRPAYVFTLPALGVPILEFLSGTTGTQELRAICVLYLLFLFFSLSSSNSLFLEHFK